MSDKIPNPVVVPREIACPDCGWDLKGLKITHDMAKEMSILRSGCTLSSIDGAFLAGAASRDSELAAWKEQAEGLAKTLKTIAVFAIEEYAHKTARAALTAYNEFKKGKSE